MALNKAENFQPIDTSYGYRPKNREELGYRPKLKPEEQEKLKEGNLIYRIISQWFLNPPKGDPESYDRYRF